MVDVQLLNDTLVALAVLVGMAIAFSFTIVAVAAIVKRGQARNIGTGGTGGTGGTRHEIPPRAPDSDDARRLVLR